MVHVVETGMDPARFSIADNRQKLRGKFGIKEDECVFACVARLAAQKNHSLLLRAYAELQKHTPRSRLLLVGDGELREELEVEARRLGLVGSVLFLGFSQNVPSILRASDVFVLSSHYEGLPYAVLEAMASGLPVVSTAVDGVIDAIVEGVTGHLVPRDDVMALARAMWQMILHPESRQLMGEAGRKRFRSRFTVEHMVEETVRLYGTIISPIKL